MSDEGIIPNPKKQVPEKIDEAFEVEKPNASLTVVVNPPAPAVPFEDVQKLMASTLADEDKTEEIKAKKQSRKIEKKRGATQIGISKGVFYLIVGWTIFVALYMVAIGLGWLSLPVGAIVALIASAALPTGLKVLVELLKSGDNDK